MTAGGLPDPLVPADVDLKDFPYTPLFRARLFGSTFHARASDAEWRAGLTLWLRSWDQVPAGTLPLDDIDLCRLAELGRDLRTWQKVKAWALHGWIECSDGRLHHKVVAEGINEAWDAKQAQRRRTEAARRARLSQRSNPSVTDRDRPLSQTGPPSVTDHESALLQTEKSSVTASKRREEKDSVLSGLANANPPSPASPVGSADPIKALWDRGLRLLTTAGATEKQARSNIGGWRKKYGDASVSAAFSRAEEARPSDPVAYIVRLLANGVGQPLDPKDPRSIGGYVPL